MRCSSQTQIYRHFKGASYDLISAKENFSGFRSAKSLFEGCAINCSFLGRSNLLSLIALFNVTEGIIAGRKNFVCLGQFPSTWQAIQSENAVKTDTQRKACDLTLIRGKKTITFSNLHFKLGSNEGTIILPKRSGH